MARVPAARSATPLVEAIRARGLRATAPRIAVLELLGRARTPQSHATIAEALVGSGWDRATIYRNLVAMTEAGLLRRADLGDHVWRFELRRPGPGARAPAHERPGRTVEHPHFLCDSCGEVTCLSDSAVEIRAGAAVPRAVRRKRVAIQIQGRCDRCAP
ncbi:MAG: transcriptional repressor [Polyangiaceae bacterium]|nr:transcriptional repressor [Polyangiaceae bacterium]